jgi:hypothetical protein
MIVAAQQIDVGDQQMDSEMALRPAVDLKITESGPPVKQEVRRCQLEEAGRDLSDRSP